MTIEHIIPLEDYIQTMQRPFVIAGPCSAESRKQLIDTARSLTGIEKVHMLRAGIWKPRSRPDYFEGVGEIGLDWLCEARDISGIPVVTEIANAHHAEVCLKKGIDAVWIGARTTVNPFYVQEIADSLKGVDIPVFVKNPVSPDIDLWVGALERFYKAGIRKLVAIHRGFTPLKQTIYRNSPMWEQPIELKTRFPHLDILCDPSHISGNSALIPELAQKAMDMNMTGLMLETHVNPKAALSDAEQQLTPAELKSLLRSLTIRSSRFHDPELKSRLEEIRKIIDRIDRELLEQFAKRMDLVDQIGEYKFDNKVTIFQLSRWKNILATRTNYAKKLELSEEFIKKLLQLIHRESIKRQTAIMNLRNEDKNN